jgi:DNA-binding transcriptional regulator YdaS (Cro superfamily)
MAKRLTSVAAAVKFLGGTGKVAAIVGVGSSAVSNWIAADRIPAKQYAVLSAALKKAGGAVDERLWGFSRPEAAE